MTELRSKDYDQPTDTAPVEPPVPPETVELLPNESRQGVTHHHVRMVLAVGTIGCAVLMGLAYLVFFA